MEKSIKGCVILKTVLSNAVEINLSCDGGEKNFKIAAGSAESIKEVKRRMADIKKGDTITLFFENDQLVRFESGCERMVFNVSDISDAGAAFNETAYKKLQVKFDGYTVENNGVRLQVRLGERSEYVIGNAVIAAYLDKRLQATAKGDSLSLMQSPYGEILNVVNQTKGFEFSCR